ncbi:MAG TPA: alpha/beta hydrolase [Nevskia sp.]|jgi:non-heme chloroperoxidase|nr:alpha/beta hydrolase [Nevskia sp.]
MQKRIYSGADGVKLAADVGGDAARQPVILLHGGGQTRHAWSRAGRELARGGYHVICLDLRGHGESGWSEAGDYRLDDFAADLRAVMGTLQRPPVLIGASLGGGTSLLVTGESAPGTVAALVLVDVVPRPEPAGVKNVYSFMSARPDGFANLDEVADAVAAYNPHRPRPSDYAGLMKNLRTRPDGRLQWHWDPKFINPRYRLDPEEYHRRLDAAARKVRVPSLLVRGALSDIVSVESARELQATIPGCEWVDVAGAGHMVAGDRNDVFNRAISEFLERHVPHAAAA